MGAEVIRVERAAGRPRRRRRDAAGWDVLQPRPAQHRRRPEAPRRRGGPARRSSSRPTRCIEGFRPGRDGAPRHRARRVPGPQPEARLRPHDRLGPGRARTPHAAGHDINYISLAGALAHIGRAGEAPVPPLNLVGDFGGGGMLLAFGVVCGLLEAQRSGEGQVVDAAMVDGAAVLMTMFWGMQAGRHLRRGRAAARTCSTPAPTSTTSTSAPTASTSRSARSSRSSTPSCCASPASRTTPSSPQQMDQRPVAGPEGAPRASCSRPRPATSGAR